MYNEVLHALVSIWGLIGTEIRDSEECLIRVVCLQSPELDDDALSTTTQSCSRMDHQLRKPREALTCLEWGLPMCRQILGKQSLVSAVLTSGCGEREQHLFPRNNRGGTTAFPQGSFTAPKVLSLLFIISLQALKWVFYLWKRADLYGWNVLFKLLRTGIGTTELRWPQKLPQDSHFHFKTIYETNKEKIFLEDS